MTEYRTIDIGQDMQLRAVMQGSGPLAIMVHGFPESWYSWRHQIGPVAEAGFTACAIDVRGYGGSSKPTRVEDYSMEAITGDIGRLIQTLSPDAPAVLIGHDWGAPIVWNTTLTQPQRVRAVCGLSVPYLGVPKASFGDMIKAVFTDRGKFFYQAYFQDVGVAEAEMDSDVRRALRLFYYETACCIGWSIHPPSRPG
jgi:pimeloyl-ACP methyl ester carboxylesterase